MSYLHKIVADRIKNDDRLRAVPIPVIEEVLRAAIAEMSGNLLAPSSDVGEYVGALDMADFATCEGCGMYGYDGDELQTVDDDCTKLCKSCIEDAKNEATSTTA